MVRYAARSVLAVNKPWMNFEVAAAIRVTTAGGGEAEKTHFHVLKCRFLPHNDIWAVKAVEASLYELQWGSNTNHSGSLGFRRLWFSRSGSHSETEGEWQPDREEGRGRRWDVRGEKRRTEKNGMKMRSDKVTDGSPDSEHNHVSLQRLKSLWRSDTAAATGALKSNSGIPHSH